MAATGPVQANAHRDLPPRWPGRHGRHFLDGRVTLDLLYGDSVAMLAQADFTADCWFLDGFTPARNPLMWRRIIFTDGGTVVCGHNAGQFHCRR